MPFAIIIIATTFIVVGINGTQHDLACLLKQDFGTGKGSFLYWMAAVFILGSLGYIDKLRPIADGFVVLLIVVLLLTKGSGIFSQLNTAFSGGSNTASPLAAGQQLLQNSGI